MKEHAKILKFVITWGHIYRGNMVSQVVQVVDTDVKDYGWTIKDTQFVEFLLKRIPEQYYTAIKNLGHAFDVPSDVAYIGSDVSPIVFAGKTEPYTVTALVRYHDNVESFYAPIGVNYTVVDGDDETFGNISGDELFAGYDASDWVIVSVNEHSIQPLTANVDFTWKAMVR